MVVEEGSVKFNAEVLDIVSREMGSFYNNKMKVNRDLTIALLKVLKPEKVGLPLAGTGVRALRIHKELNVKNIFVNDVKKDFKKEFENNIKLNNFDKKCFTIENTEANLFLRRNRPFDYVDIDPFGSPNPFLDSAIYSLTNNSVLGVTATDTAALAGTYPKACLRKYFSIPIKDECKHEWGLRILIRKVQLIASQYDKALIPLLSYSKDHHIKVFFKCLKKRSVVDDLLKQHNFINNKGPFYTGPLHDPVVKKLDAEGEAGKLLDFIKEEVDFNQVGFYDLHELSSELKIPHIPRTDKVLEILKEKGFKSCKTHISKTGIKSEINKEELKKIILQLS